MIESIVAHKVKTIETSVSSLEIKSTNHQLELHCLQEDVQKNE